jgi:glyoxylase I family protein
VPEFSNVSHVALTVTDLDRSMAWYADVLGLQLLVPTERPGIRGALFLHPPTGLMVGLAQHESGSDAAFDERRAGLDHLSFGVPDREALARWEQHLSEKGVAHSGIQDVPYGSVLVFRDPDNVQLELFALPAGATP